MARACWRCVEPIEDTASMCPSCGARVIPFDAASSTRSRTRNVRIIGLAGLSVLVLLILVFASSG